MKSSTSNNTTVVSPISIQNSLNIYTAYSYFGARAVPIVAGSSLADGALAKYAGTTKNYAGLSAFWGYVAYNAISKLHKSDYVANKYKAPLDVFFALSAIGMAWKGYDFIGSGGLNFAKSLKAGAVSAKLFEGEGCVISHVEQAFQESYMGGVFASIKNLKSILSNKFIATLLLKQGVNIAKLVVIEKYFSNLLSISKLSLYYAYEKGEGANSILKVLVPTMAKFLITSFVDNYISPNLNIDKEVSMRVADIVLKQTNTSTVMELGRDINSFSRDISSSIREANSSIEGLSQGIIVPLIYSHNASPVYDIHSAIKNYSNLIIFESLMKEVISFGNVNAIQKYIASKILRNQEAEVAKEKVGVGMKSIKMGGSTIKMIDNSEKYSYANIQDIAKYGASDFMFEQVKSYIKHSDPSSYAPSKLREAIEMMKSFVSSGMFLIFLPSLNVEGPEELQKLESLLSRLANLIDNSADGKMFITMADGAVDKASKTYKALLKNTSASIAERGLSGEVSLVVENYLLNKKSEDNGMLCIKSQKFLPGQVYAISGTIGTGKTTFLSDIAKCLNTSVFKSAGSILYPTLDGELLVGIFCGTELFSPPATTLFQRLTYRLPTEYVDSNSQNLAAEILGIFKEFGQEFNGKNLADKGFECSTGQGKLAILISAIIYKNYLQKPVLFAIDETLANLDRVTSDKVCSYIKKIFADSIVISVDHNWQGNPNFYDLNVDLAGFKPGAAVEGGEGEKEQGVHYDHSNVDESSAMLGESGSVDFVE